MAGMCHCLPSDLWKHSSSAVDCACPEGTVELDGVCVEPSACAGKLKIIMPIQR